MKKFVFSLIAIIVILLIIVLFKNFTSPTTKYSNDDVANLILKGVENMDNMSNVSFELKTQELALKYYYKGNKMKMLALENLDGTKTNTLTRIINLDEGKQYIIDEERKIMVVQNENTIDKGFQFKLAQSLESNNNPNNQRRTEYKYIKDEILEGKDCILVEEVIFYLENGTYINRNESLPEEEVYFYWIEKSTGFVLGLAMMKADQYTATPGTIIENISFGNVVDSDFEIPTTGYQIIESK